MIQVNKVEILIADDDPHVRETFKDLVVDYKRDIEKKRRDNNLGLIFDYDYKVYYDEAEDGRELKSKIANRLEQNPEQYFVSFVDEDMPVCRGTDAIAGITELMYSINRSMASDSRHMSRPKIRMVSYTQKQHIDITEGLARDSGATMFLRKTGLDDFYEEMIRIVEHLVIDMTSLEPVNGCGSRRNASICLLGKCPEKGASRFREYMKFRYWKEVLVGKISREKYNNAWMYPDLADFFSVPIGIYVVGNSGEKLIACARLVLPHMQSESTILLEDLLSRYAGLLPGLDGNFTKPPNDSVKLDKYYVDRNYTAYGIPNILMDYAVSFAMHAGHKKVRWEVTPDLAPLAGKFGFSNPEKGSGEDVLVSELNLKEQLPKSLQTEDLISEAGFEGSPADFRIGPVILEN